jgi:hypothetical protein
MGHRAAGADIGISLSRLRYKENAWIRVLARHGPTTSCIRCCHTPPTHHRHRFRGNTILVTGGGSGIGRRLAEALHRHGNKLIIVGRRLSVLEEVVAANPGTVAVEINVSSESSIEAAAARLIADYPDLKMLINNASNVSPYHASRSRRPCPA